MPASRLLRDSSWGSAGSVPGWPVFVKDQSPPLNSLRRRKRPIVVPFRFIQPLPLVGRRLQATTLVDEYPCPPSRGIAYSETPTPHLTAARLSESETTFG